MIRRLVPLVLMLVLIGCSRGTEVTVLARDELPTNPSGESVVPQTDVRTVRASLYFVRTSSDPTQAGVPLSPPKLAKIERESEPSTLPEAEIVVDLLLANPTADEPTLRTAIPGDGPAGPEPDTELLSISVGEDGLADVNLSAQFESAESELLQLMRVAQVVYTLTELSEVDAVRFSIHGAAQPVVDQDGLAHEQVTREQYSRFAPVASELGEVGESQIRAD